MMDIFFLFPKLHQQRLSANIGRELQQFIRGQGNFTMNISTLIQEGPPRLNMAQRVRLSLWLITSAYWSQQKLHYCCTTNTPALIFTHCRKSYLKMQMASPLVTFHQSPSEPYLSVDGRKWKYTLLRTINL